MDSKLWKYIKALRTKLYLIQPDAQSIATVYTDVHAQLDVARSGDSGTTVMDGSELTLYEDSNATMLYFAGGTINWTGLNAGAGEDTTIRGYWKNASGGAYVKFYEEVFLEAALPDPLGTPVPRDANIQCTPSTMYNVYGVKITAQQAAIGGGWNTLTHEWFDGKPGS